jgi:hypothetical protein
MLYKTLLLSFLLTWLAQQKRKHKSAKSSLAKMLIFSILFSVLQVALVNNLSLLQENKISEKQLKVPFISPNCRGDERKV